jgi:rubrerythrin
MKAAGGRRSRIFLALPVLAVLGAFLAGCGGGGGGDTTSTAAVEHAPAAEEQASDAEMMNVALTQELTLIQVYNHSLRLLHGEEADLARQFLAQEQEHVDGITRTLRGLQGETDAEGEEVDYTRVKTAEDAVFQLYGMTNLQLRHYIDDVAHLNTVAPRSFVTTMAANEAQHLVAFRQLLGADLGEAVPEAFDGGEVPPPVEKTGVKQETIRP